MFNYMYIYVEEVKISVNMPKYLQLIPPITNDNLYLTCLYQLQYFEICQYFVYFYQLQYFEICQYFVYF